MYYSNEGIQKTTITSEQIDKIELSHTSPKIEASEFPWADYVFNTFLICIDNEKHKGLLFFPFSDKAA